MRTCRPPSVRAAHPTALLHLAWVGPGLLMTDEREGGVKPFPIIGIGASQDNVMTHPDNSSPLRAAAEAQLAAKPVTTPAQPVAELQHELQVHQIELEMQNETLRQTQRALEESRDRYLDLYEFAPVGYLTLSALGLIEAINLTGARLLGRERNGLLHHRFSACVAPADRDAWQRQFLSVKRHGEPHSVELALQRGDGSLFQAQLDYASQNNSANGTALRVVFSDISARKTNEEQLRKLYQVVEQSSESIMITNIDSTIEYVNASFERNTGYSRTEVIGKNPRLLRSGKTPQETYVALWDALTHDQAWQGEFINRHKDGSEYIELARFTPIRQTDGCISHYVAVKENITEKKHMGDELDRHRHHLEDMLAERTAALREAETRYRTVADFTYDWETWIDAAGHWLYCSPACERVTGYRAEEFMARPELYLEIAHDDDRASLLNHLHAGEGSGVEDIEYRIQHKNGEERWIEHLCQPVQDATGQSLGRRVSNRDITERKRADEALRLARNQAEAATLAKSTFLANMSHEIRTPINAVLGFSDLCLRQELPERARDYVEKTHGAAKSLLGIINEILDFSKIEAGKLVIESVPFSLGEVLHDIANLFSQKAREKGIELVIGAQPEVPDRLVGDPLRLTQILTNLTSNALKFTAHGGVELTVEAPAATGVAATLRFIVNDSGVGMTPEQVAGLFNPFSQADSSTTRKYGGTGLGLVISKQLLEHMGGSIEVSSLPGQGSTFSATLTLPLAIGEDDALPARSPLVGKRVLVVDDSKVMRTLLARSVEAFGCEAVSVGTAVDMQAILQRGMCFDLILLDWRLPDLDGLSLARQLRITGNPTPIVLVTGDQMSEARAGDIENDIQAFLAKPVSRSSLHDTMVEVLGGHTVLPSLAVAQHTTPNLSGAHVLLVDDNDFNRQVGRELINLTGATVSTANDGAEAVAAVAVGQYDLVLMDLQMPVMDGYTAATQIRQRWPDLPVLALTAHALVEERQNVLAAGMNDILTKPILPDMLFSMLQRWLPKPATEQVAEAPSLPAVPPAPTVVLDGFDMDMALLRVSGNRQMLERFLRLFRDRNVGALDEIKAALARADWPTARRLAHTLKGSAGTVGLVALQTAAAHLETSMARCVKDGETPQQPGNDNFATMEIAWTQAQRILAALLDGKSSAASTGETA